MKGRGIARSIAGVTGIVGILAGGCSSKGTASTTPADTTPVRIAWIPKSATNVVYAAGKSGAELAGKDLSSASGRDVEVIYMAPAEETGPAQVTVIEQAIADGVDAIEVAPFPEAVPSIDKAVAAGIPVLTFDADAPTSQRVSYYGLDNAAGGAMAAKLLAKLMGDKGKVAILAQANGNIAERAQGFQNELAANHPNITVAINKPCESADGDCTAIVEQVVADYPDLGGWFFARPRPLREDLDAKMPKWKASAKAGVKAVAFDSTSQFLPVISQGLVQATIGQKYFGWGYDITNVTFDLVTRGKKVASFIDSGYDVVCSNNVAQMTSIWETQDFRQTLAPCDILK
jgi:ribose transport system substrate-binding protein